MFLIKIKNTIKNPLNVFSVYWMIQVLYRVSEKFIFEELLDYINFNSLYVGREWLTAVVDGFTLFGVAWILFVEKIHLSLHEWLMYEKKIKKELL